jgi:hypothetical protein
MYMREPAEEAVASSPGILFRTGLAVTGVATLIFGLFPALVTAATDAASVFHV